ncbi:MAG: cpt [Elusimicrobia bacterium]|nr:MAG: cpt [Elusimicrobiota bacterium]KAF0153934.1 MAG: cpt [Elusimicrobiota bacterium]
MIRLLLSLTFFASLSLNAFASEAPEKSSLSFNQLLRSMSAAYEAPPVPNVEEPVPAIEKALENDPRFWITVAAATKEERTRLLELGLSIEEVTPTAVSGIIHRDSLPAFETKSVNVISRMPLSQFAVSAFKDFPSQDAAYHNYREMYDRLKALETANSDIVSLFSIGKTVENREIWTLRINSSAKGTKPSSKPGAVFQGAHHAREHLSVEVPLLFAVWLLENRNNAEVKKFITTLDIYIQPMINPDGAEYDISTGKYKWWRKNMSVNSGSQGVDLNRNYDSWWCQAGASNSPWADTYCGPAAFSEPESRAVRDFVKARPNLKTMISYHTYGELILYPWGGKYEDIPDQNDLKVFKNIAQGMARLTGYTAQKSSDLYAATGDSCDWAYAEAGIFAFTFELTPKGGWGGGGTFYPGAGVIEKSVRDNVQAALYLLRNTGDPRKAAAE